jgi:hypothetical protein
MTYFLIFAGSINGRGIGFVIFTDSIDTTTGSGPTTKVLTIYMALARANPAPSSWPAIMWSTTRLCTCASEGSQEPVQE